MKSKISRIMISRDEKFVIALCQHRIREIESLSVYNHTFYSVITILLEFYIVIVRVCILNTVMNTHI